MKPKHLLIVAAAAFALLALRLFLVGPEERVRRLLHDLAAEASKTGEERPIVAAAKARSLADAFALDAVGEDRRDGGRVEGRDGIARAIGWVRASWTVAEVELEELEVRLAGEEAAEAQGVVRVRGPDGEAISSEDGSRVRLELARIGGDWRIVRAEVDRPDQ